MLPSLSSYCGIARDLHSYKSVLLANHYQGLVHLLMSNLIIDFCDWIEDPRNPDQKPFMSTSAESKKPLNRYVPRHAATPILPRFRDSRSLY